MRSTVIDLHSIQKSNTNHLKKTQTYKIQKCSINNFTVEPVYKMFDDARIVASQIPAAIQQKNQRIHAIKINFKICSVENQETTQQKCATARPDLNQSQPTADHAGSKRQLLVPQVVDQTNYLTQPKNSSRQSERSKAGANRNGYL